MTTQIEAMKMALEALEIAVEYAYTCEPDAPFHLGKQAITALRSAIEAAKKVEPDTVVHNTDTPGHFAIITPAMPAGSKLYLHPPSAEIEELRKDVEQPKVPATQDEFLFWFNATFPNSGVDEYWAFDLTQQWFKYAAIKETP